MGWARDGWSNLGPALGPSALEALRAELDAWAPGAPRNDYGLLYHNLWWVLPGFRALVEEGEIAARILDATGIDELLLFQDNLVCKLPGNPTEIQWHQDASYWPLSGWRGVTSWLCLDDADLDNGAMEHIPGSHGWGVRAPADFIRGAGQPVDPALPPLEPEGKPRITAHARAGELLIHHPLLWHRSGPNRGARPRRAWSVNWIAPDLRWDLGHAPHPYAWALRPPDGGPVEGERFPRFRRGDLASGAPRRQTAGE